MCVYFTLILVLSLSVRSRGAFEETKSPLAPGLESTTGPEETKSPIAPGLVSTPGSDLRPQQLTDFKEFVGHLSGVETVVSPYDGTRCVSTAQCLFTRVQPDLCAQKTHIGDWVKRDDRSDMRDFETDLSLTVDEKLKKLLVKNVCVSV